MIPNDFCNYYQTQFYLVRHSVNKYQQLFWLQLFLCTSFILTSLVSGVSSSWRIAIVKPVLVACQLNDAGQVKYVKYFTTIFVPRVNSITKSSCGYAIVVCLMIDVLARKFLTLLLQGRYIDLNPGLLGTVWLFLTHELESLAKPLEENIMSNISNRLILASFNACPN